MKPRKIKRRGVGGGGAWSPSLGRWPGGRVRCREGGSPALLHLQFLFTFHANNSYTLEILFAQVIWPSLLIQSESLCTSCKKLVALELPINLDVPPWKGFLKDILPLFDTLPIKRQTTLVYRFFATKKLIYFFF